MSISQFIRIFRDPVSGAAGAGAAAAGLGPAALIPAGLGLITGGIKAIGAGKQLKKDKAELARLTPAFYKVQDEYYNNKNSAAELAQGGLTQNAKDFYGDMAGRGLSTGVSGVLQAGGSPNDIAKIFDSYNTSISELGVKDAETHINNIKYYHQVGKDLAGQKTQQWAINEYAPYQNKLKELTQRIDADKKNIWGGIDQAIGSVQAGVTSMQNEKMINNLFKSGVPGAEGSATGGGAANGLLSTISAADPFNKNSSAPSSFNKNGGMLGINFRNVANDAMTMQRNSDATNFFQSMSQEDLSSLMEQLSQAFKPKE